jgi:hypothetical protein
LPGWRPLPSQATNEVHFDKKEVLSMKRIVASCLTIVLVAAAATFWGTASVNAENTVDAELTTAIGKLSPEQKAALLVLVKGIVEAQVQESPADGAMKTVAAYVKAAESAELETLMNLISDEFSHYEVGDKAGYRSFLEQVKGDGMLEDIKGNLADAKAEVKGDTVTVYPVELEGLFGTVTMEFELKKSGPDWKIVGLDMTGV